MTESDRILMEKAASLAETCEPVNDGIPKVAAIIAIGGATIGQGRRGTGKEKDDDHAEKRALESVNDASQLPSATLYTTLEPCTMDVRSDPLNCCTELIKRSRIRRVFIGILDPNQGVTGKGLWDLQSNGIEVELFPHSLSERIRTANRDFIRKQQTLGIVITNLQSGQKIKTYNNGGVFDVKGSFLNTPGADVFALTGIGGQWWPQPYSLHVAGDKTWTARLHFGSYGPHTICIVKANELGISLIKYYRKVVAQNVKREAMAKDYFSEHNLNAPDLLGELSHKYLGIEMGAFPKGIEVLDVVEIEVERPPATVIEINQTS
jgi:pyrimidine deaminase RibD-like protein